MNKTEALAKIEQNNKENIELKKFVEDCDKRAVERDYTKFVRYWNGFPSPIAIMGDKMLKCFDDGDFTYSNACRGHYTEIPPQKRVKCSELKVGQVVYMFPDEEEEVRLSSYGRYAGKTDNGYLLFNFLYDCGGIEIVSRYLFGEDRKDMEVILFTREE